MGGQTQQTQQTQWKEIMTRVTQDSINQIFEKLLDGLDDAALQYMIARDDVIGAFDTAWIELFDTAVQNLFDHLTAYITEPGGDNLVVGFGLHEDHYATFSIAALQAEALLEEKGES